jgi:hypothetical protein
VSPFTENLDPFFSTSDFGETVTIAGQAVVVVWFEPSADAIGIAGTKPSLVCPTAKLPAGLEEGHVVLRGTHLYAIALIQPDGTGVTTLVLEDRA